MAEEWRESRKERIEESRPQSVSSGNRTLHKPKRVWRRNGGNQGKKEKRKVVPKVFLQEIEPCAKSVCVCVCVSEEVFLQEVSSGNVCFFKKFFFRK